MRSVRTSWAYPRFICYYRLDERFWPPLRGDPRYILHIILTRTATPHVTFPLAPDYIHDPFMTVMTLLPTCSAIIGDVYTRFLSLYNPFVSVLL